MNVIKCEVKLFLFSWNMAKVSKLRTLRKMQIISHIHGKTSPKPMARNSLDEKTKYLKTDYVKNRSLEIILLKRAACWTERIATERA